MSVNTPHDQYRDKQALADRCRALYAGSYKVRELGEEILPRLASEEDDSYAYRKNVAALNPSYEKALQVSVGTLLLHAPSLTGTAVPDDTAFFEDVDGLGTSVGDFCDVLLTDGLLDGVAGIFTDYSLRTAAKSRDEEQAMGARAYWIAVKRCDIFQSIYANNLTMHRQLLFVRRETSQVEENFVITIATKYHVYRQDMGGAVTFETWSAIGAETPTRDVGGPTLMPTLKEIPWSPLITGGLHGDGAPELCADPAMLSLADLVIEWHQTRSNLLSFIGTACSPPQVRIGAQKDADGKYPPIRLGTRAVIEAPHIDGLPKPVYWHTPDVSVCAKQQQVPAYLIKTHIAS